ncbi:MAG: 3-dehydroquinate synthase [Oscillospiraceae bacterium]|nr:3-dehydroquinate synthase [Oscillospiraceae bacterium]
MTTIEVNASKHYTVEIGSGLLPGLGPRLAALGGAQRVCIVSDSNVWPLYGAAADASLHAAGLETCAFIFPAGESSKNGATYLELLNFLAENRLSRSDILVALGGGVVGDLTGFAAATYQRGIRFVQVPTTVLAAVDSSVGGKTAIDLPAGKNLAGAFCQPSHVLCDIDCLSTLPDDIFRDGCAEVIKTAILFDEKLFMELIRDGLKFDRERVIAACVRHKRDIVVADEFDRGQRNLLNLGHTFGHAVEKLSDFTLSHGKAVAIGTAMAARAAVSLGLADQGTATRIMWLLERFGLPIFTHRSAEALTNTALSDKKRTGDSVKLILPKAVGECAIVPTPVSKLESIIQAGL